MINNLIILILFFILSFTIVNYSRDNFSELFDGMVPPYGMNYVYPYQNDNYNCYSITNETSCNNKPGCYYDNISHICNTTQISYGDNCHLSVSDFSCSIEDDCKWINGKCISTKSHETCDEIKNEVNCNNSNLNCIYDNSSSKCLNHTQDNKSKGNYEYYDKDCNTLKQRGHKVYCTYDKNNIEDESLFFNLNKVIDTDKKRYKTCYGSNCIIKQNTQQVITDSGCSSNKNRITCDMQDNCEYINYQCVPKNT
jgi:hypothetical protein